MTDNANFTPSAIYFTNAIKSPPIPLNLALGQENNDQDDYFGVSNSIWSKPFQKVKHGCKTFEEIIKKHAQHSHNPNNSSKQEQKEEGFEEQTEPSGELIEDLLNFLRNDTQYVSCIYLHIIDGLDPKVLNIFYNLKFNPKTDILTFECQ